jgi:hypothetical protein
MLRSMSTHNNSTATHVHWSNLGTATILFSFSYPLMLVQTYGLPPQDVPSTGCCRHGISMPPQDMTADC